MIDMTNNRVPYGLLTDEEKAVLKAHAEAGGEFVFTCGGEDWGELRSPNWLDNIIYRTVPLTAKTIDVISWEKLPDWVQWVARDADFEVLGHSLEPNISRDSTWLGHGERRRIDDFPDLVQIGTVDWKDSLQRRPRG
jgi:hypothetical protein